MQVRRWHNFSDTTAMQRAVLAAIVSSAATSIKVRGAFHIVLAGGRTPESIYKQLRTLATDWRVWSIYFGDERCLPSGDIERNDSMARAAWLDHVAIPAAQIHSIPAHLGPTVGAELYNATLATVGDFDLVLLGLGEDGHTASLFPGDSAALTTTAAAVAINNAPKLPTERVSLTSRRLSCAERVLFLVSGDGKREAISHWQRGQAIPASLIEPPSGVDIYTDISLR
jgi:6-phosphogluconolactonase